MFFFVCISSCSAVPPQQGPFPGIAIRSGAINRFHGINLIPDPADAAVRRGAKDDTSEGFFYPSRCLLFFYSKAYTITTTARLPKNRWPAAGAFCYYYVTRTRFPVQGVARNDRLPKKERLTKKD